MKATLDVMGERPVTIRLLDIADFLLSRADQPEEAAILDNLTLLMIPMLNPDGAEVYQRRNFQGIDINRRHVPDRETRARMADEIRLLTDLGEDDG